MEHDAFAPARQARVIELQAHAIPARWQPSEVRVVDWFDLGSKVLGIGAVLMMAALVVIQLHKAGWL